MKTDQVKKVNYGYLLAYILMPAALMALGLWIGYTVYEDGEIGAVMFNMCSFIVAVLLWVFGGRIVYFFAKKRMLKQLDGAGVDRRQGGAAVFLEPLRALCDTRRPGDSGVGGRRRGWARCAPGHQPGELFIRGGRR